MQTTVVLVLAILGVACAANLKGPDGGLAACKLAEHYDELVKDAEDAIVTEKRVIDGIKVRITAAEKCIEKGEADIEEAKKTFIVDQEWCKTESDAAEERDRLMAKLEVIEAGIKAYCGKHMPPKGEQVSLLAELASFHEQVTGEKPLVLPPPTEGPDCEKQIGRFCRNLHYLKDAIKKLIALEVQNVLECIEGKKEEMTTKIDDANDRIRKCEKQLGKAQEEFDDAQTRLEQKTAELNRLIKIRDRARKLCDTFDDTDKYIEEIETDIHDHPLDEPCEDSQEINGIMDALTSDTDIHGHPGCPRPMWKPSKKLAAGHVGVGKACISKNLTQKYTYDWKKQGRPTMTTVEQIQPKAEYQEIPITVQNQRVGAEMSTSNSNCPWNWLRIGYSVLWVYADGPKEISVAGRCDDECIYMMNEKYVKTLTWNGYNWEYFPVRVEKGWNMLESMGADGCGAFRWSHFVKAEITKRPPFPKITKVVKNIGAKIGKAVKAVGKFFSGI